MKQFFSFLSEQLSAHLNENLQILGQQQVFGGDINHTFHLQTNIGSFFLKLNDDCFPDMFEKEYAGLQLLHQTKTIKIPKPLLHGCFENKIFLITEFIQKGEQSKIFWQTFGQQLAALHKYSANKFGLVSNNYIGSLQQQNNFCNSWNEFYARQRITPLAELAFNQKKLNKEDISLAEKLCRRLHNLLPEEAPALIHGDLWNGNFMSNKNGEPVIYDPAVYYGNREMDIAMSLLFGGFDQNFYDHYNEAFPLQPGWQKRVELCQLYPLLVHLVLFDGHYYEAVKSIIKHYA